MKKYFPSFLPAEGFDLLALSKHIVSISNYGVFSFLAPLFQPVEDTHSLQAIMVWYYTNHADT